MYPTAIHIPNIQRSPYSEVLQTRLSEFFRKKKQLKPSKTQQPIPTQPNPPQPTNPSLHHPTASCEVPKLPVVQGTIGIDFFHKGQIHRDLPRFLPTVFKDGRRSPVESGPGKSRPGKDRLGRIFFSPFFSVSTR